MKRTSAKVLTVFVTVLLSLVSANVAAEQKFGFGTRQGSCSLWLMPFPISLKRSYYNVPGWKYDFNVIWIDDTGNKGLDNYVDLYTSAGNSTWIKDILNGSDKPICTKTDGSGCVQAKFAAVGHGVSAYDQIKKEYSGDKVKVFSGSMDENGDYYWIYYLPVRKVKLLRVEIFTPFTGGKEIDESVEPLFFEYRKTGAGDELHLTSSGSTAPKNSGIVLPDTISLTKTISEINVWVEDPYVSEAPNAWDNVKPGTSFISTSAAQVAAIPEACQ
ncbi:hypothetical protein [Enterobacter cloacae complex sp. I2]|uniref:hypothetical protein n=1 Tax=Enterobacter cloacae complex sp. I2 TaxID=2779603 RepID=UPI001867F86E|nr:hypothetical protein [Enterobacter cloacae complex sp. I2]MBE3514034.1 hypothetical protein [Enterobacter cloacae complex sp. I2]